MVELVQKPPKKHILERYFRVLDVNFFPSTIMMGLRFKNASTDHVYKTGVMLFII